MIDSPQLGLDESLSSEELKAGIPNAIEAARAERSISPIQAVVEHPNVDETVLQELFRVGGKQTMINSSVRALVASSPLPLSADFIRKLARPDEWNSEETIKSPSNSYRFAHAGSVFYQLAQRSDVPEDILELLLEYAQGHFAGVSVISTLFNNENLPPLLEKKLQIIALQVPHGRESTEAQRQAYQHAIKAVIGDLERQIEAAPTLQT